MIKIPLQVVVSLGCATFAVHAHSLDITTYEKHRAEPTGSQNRGLQRIYLIAVGEGFKWANASLGSRKQPLLFCAPENLPLTAENYTQLVDDALASNRAKYLANELPIEAILLFELQSRLLCTTK